MWVYIWTWSAYRIRGLNTNRLWVRRALFSIIKKLKHSACLSLGSIIEKAKKKACETSFTISIDLTSVMLDVHENTLSGFNQSGVCVKGWLYHKVVVSEYRVLWFMRINALLIGYVCLYFSHRQIFCKILDISFYYLLINLSTLCCSKICIWSEFKLRVHMFYWWVHSSY